MANLHPAQLLEIDSFKKHLNEDDLRCFLWVDRSTRHIALNIIQERSQQTGKHIDLNITLKAAHSSLSIFKQQRKLHYYYFHHIKYTKPNEISGHILNYYAFGNKEILEWVLNEYKSRPNCEEQLNEFEESLTCEVRYMNEIRNILKYGSLEVLKYLYEKYMSNVISLEDIMAFNYSIIKRTTIRDQEDIVINIRTLYTLELFINNIKDFKTKGIKNYIDMILIAFIKIPLQSLKKILKIKFIKHEILKNIIEYFNNNNTMLNKIIPTIPLNTIMWIKKLGVDLNEIICRYRLLNIRKIYDYDKPFNIPIDTLLYILDHDLIHQYSPINTMYLIICIIKQTLFENATKKEIEKLKQYIIITLTNNITKETIKNNKEQIIFHIELILKYSIICAPVEITNEIISFMEKSKHFNICSIIENTNMKSILGLDRVIKYAKILKYIIKHNYKILHTKLSNCLYFKNIGMGHISYNNYKYYKYCLTDEDIINYMDIIIGKMKSETMYNREAFIFLIGDEKQIIQYPIQTIIDLNYVDVLKHLLKNYSKKFINEHIDINRINLIHKETINCLEKHFGEKMFTDNVKNNLLHKALSTGDKNTIDWVYNKYKDYYNNQNNNKPNTDNYILKEYKADTILKEIILKNLRYYKNIDGIKWIVETNETCIKEYILNHERDFSTWVFEKNLDVVNYILKEVLEINPKTLLTDHYLNCMEFYCGIKKSMNIVDMLIGIDKEYFVEIIKKLIKIHRENIRTTYV